MAPAIDSSRRLLDELTGIAARACSAILSIAPTALDLRHKQDQSPLTAADEAAEAVILDGLARVLPGTPVVSEEAAARPSALPSPFILVDPLDGTREFVAGRPEYTVNIALIREGRPVLGVVAGPALHVLWRASMGDVAERLQLSPDGAALSPPTAIRTRKVPADGLVATVSRSHGDAESEAFLDRLPVAHRTTFGSSAKFCLVAEGSADLYARLGPTSEWDIAAGHAVLAAAGGLMTAPDGQPIRYGDASHDFRVPGFVAWGEPAAAERYRR